MKEFNLLIWLTQLGLSVAVPLAGCLLLALWLHHSCGWGTWVILIGLIIGLISAVNGFRSSLRAMELMSKNRNKQEPPPVAFNDHH